MKQESNTIYRLVLKDCNGCTKLDIYISIEDFSNLLDGVNVFEAVDDVDLEYYFIKHSEMRIIKEGKKYYHQKYFSGKGVTPTFVFIEE